MKSIGFLMLFATTQVFAADIKSELAKVQGSFSPVSDCSISYFRKARGLGTADSFLALKRFDLSFNGQSDDRWLNISLLAARTKDSVNVSTDVGGYITWRNPELGFNRQSFPIERSTWNDPGNGVKRTLKIKATQDDISFEHEEKLFRIPFIPFQTTRNLVKLEKIDQDEFILHFEHSEVESGSNIKTSILDCRLQKN